MMTMLGSLGINNVDSASNGLEALSKMEEQDYDILMLDLNMPKMDGIQFISKASEFAPNSNLIVMSGSDRPILNAAASVAKSKNMTLLGILEKPFTVQQIEELLEEFSNLSPAPKAAPTAQKLISPEEVEKFISNDAVELHYQPKIDVKTERVVSAEALARLKSDDGTILYPGSFLDVVKYAGLDQKLTKKVISIAFKDLAEWTKSSLDINVAINVTNSDLDDPGFADYIIDEAAKYGINLKNITIEVTEHRIITNIGQALEALARLRMNGASIAIDDFGTGASTLQQLKQLPCTELKVDKLFVTNAYKDNMSQQILKSCIALGKALDLNIVAEGVETIEDKRLIQSLGVNIIQGWFYSKALPLNEFIEYTNKQNTWS